MEILSVSLSAAEIWSQWVWPAIMLAIGLGSVIFVHELGHFLVAKAVGIRVEKFSIGFGPKLWSTKRGETEYQLAVFPLGGYIKMLGQEDFKQLDENAPKDPRAYNNKPVWARLAVVSAGVVMNIIFAFILYYVVFGILGIKFLAPDVGGVQAGYPADQAVITWSKPLPATSQPASEPAVIAATTSKPSLAPNQSVGLKPGDEITAIDNWAVKNFGNIQVKALLAGSSDKANFRIRRVIDGKTYLGTAEVGVKRTKEGSFIFGIHPRAEPVFQFGKGGKVNFPLRDGDHLVAIDGKPLRNEGNVASVQEVLESLTPGVLKLTVEREDKQAGTTRRVEIALPPEFHGGGLYDTSGDAPAALDAVVLNNQHGRLTLQFRDGHTETRFDSDVSFVNPRGGLLNILGLSPRVKIQGVVADGPADKSGLLPGDVIVNYGDLGTSPSIRQIKEINTKFGDVGTTIVVLRDEKMLPAIPVKPGKAFNKASNEFEYFLKISNSLDYMNPVVGSIEKDSVAAKADIQPGDVIEEINGQKVADWYAIYRVLRSLQDQDVKLTVRRNQTVLTLPAGKLDVWSFDPNRYSMYMPQVEDMFGFRPAEVTIYESNPTKAIRLGLRETYYFTINTYVSLKALIAGTVSAKEVRGPLGIGSAAIKAGRESAAHLIYLMAMISISLAVVNFLPIPVVDGGHAVFLLIEKITRKPVSTKVMNIAQIFGLALLLGLFVLAMWNDIGRFIKGQW